LPPQEAQTLKYLDVSPPRFGNPPLFLLFAVLLPNKKRPVDIMTEEVIPYYSPSVRTRFPTVVEEISGIPLEPENGQSPKAPAARIGYFFDREDYQSRVAFREGSNNLQKTVPEGWPTALTGRRVWSGLELKNENEFVYILTKAENYEVTQALKQYTSTAVFSSNYSLVIY